MYLVYVLHLRTTMHQTTRFHLKFEFTSQKFSRAHRTQDDHLLVRQRRKADAMHNGDEVIKPAHRHIEQNLTFYIAYCDNE